MTIWMIDTMVSMTLLMALVLIIRKPVSQFFGAHIAYLLWALPLARLFMPTLTLKAPAPTAGADAAVATPLLSDIAVHVSGKAAAVSELASIDWMMIALVIWIGGGGMLFISKLAAYFQFREDIVSDGQLVGRHGRIKILETAAVGGPLAFGLFEKYIAVPTNFFRDYAPRERELALEHEIVHHESGDLAANFVGLLVLSLHWFNPVAWYAWIAFRQDQETACDARVLQNGGRDLRAVYGRTIAKSVSGHRLGLASPLNQKNKIKDRLKMLGQTEKSTFRKRMGALMIGASTVAALPLTATVTYAVEAEAHPKEIVAEDTGYPNIGINSGVVAGNVAGINAGNVLHLQAKGKLEDKELAKDLQKNTDLSRAVPAILAAPMPPMPPAAPAAPAALEFTAYDQPGGTVHLTMLNGKAMVVRTNGIHSKEEIRNMAEKAAASRHEAVERLREAKLAQQDMRASLAEARRDVREAQREAHEAREAMAAARDAEKQAGEAEKKAREARSLTSRIWEISQITFKPYFRSTVSSMHQSNSSRAGCTAISREIAIVGAGAMDAPAWTYVGTKVGDCTEVDQKAVLTVALKSLENKRAEAAECNENDNKQRLMVEAFDRDIKTLKAHLSIT